MDALEARLAAPEGMFEDIEPTETWKASVAFSVPTRHLREPLPAAPTAKSDQFDARWRMGKVHVVTSAGRLRGHRLHLKLHPPFPEPQDDAVLLVLTFAGPSMYG